jgi:hypothetical protein
MTAAIQRKDAIQDLLDSFYDPDEEQEALAVLLEPRYLAMLRGVHELVQATFPTMEEFRLDDAATRRLLDYAAEQVVRIDETTREALREQLRIGQERGYSAWEIANGVPKDDYRGIDGLFRETWRNRALTVARNELAAAQLEASKDRYKATGLVDRLQLRDGTGTAPDQPCLDRNGQVVPLNSNPQQLHIQCTLVVIPVLRGDPNPPRSNVPPVVIGEPTNRF